MLLASVIIAEVIVGDVKAMLAIAVLSAVVQTVSAGQWLIVVAIQRDSVATFVAIAIMVFVITEVAITVAVNWRVAVITSNKIAVPSVLAIRVIAVRDCMVAVTNVGYLIVIVATLMFVHQSRAKSLNSLITVVVAISPL